MENQPTPQPLTPEVVSAILRDPDSPLYPSRICVFCDECGTEFVGEFMVSEEQTSTERLEVARAHMRTQGWQCDRAGDYCPEHKRAAADEPSACIAHGIGDDLDLLPTAEGSDQ
ncbi:hypothetical protein ACIREM_32880 [Streptomyces shenzhenensis]|uniref:hypothetical protein n=1 Tax=Streptomyces shenzhenensis TaxID=943815 RepID=UPI0037FD1F5D